MRTTFLLTRVAFVGILAVFSASQEMAAQHPLDSWVRRSVAAPSKNLNGVAYGNGVFVAVGDESFVARSIDGATWSTSNAGAFGNLARVRFLNGQFVAVGSSDKILSSTDGITWASNTLPGANFWDVAWGNGVYLLAGSATYVSPDGVSWTATHPMLINPFESSYETLLDTVVFGDGGFMGLPTGGKSPGFSVQRQSVFSTDGVNWTTGGPAPTSLSGYAGECELAFGNGLWLATSERDSAFTGAFISTNKGGTWCCRFAGDFGPGGLAVSFGQGHYLWIQEHGYQTIFTSTNGFDWERRFQETNVTRARSSTFGNGTFVAVGVDGDNASYILQSGNISGAPTIFQQPQDRGAVANNPATLSVQAVGAPTLTYQWYKNGTAIANETNTVFSIANVQTGDNGGYRVVITNFFGSVTSRVAQLTVAFLDINNYAGVKVFGVPGRTYRIDATPASGTPNWQTLTNLVLPSSPYIWIDYASPTLPARLYRASELP